MIAAVAAVLITATVLGGVTLSRMNRGRPSASQPSAPPAAALPASFTSERFNCIGSFGVGVGSAPSTAHVDAVSVTSGKGFDRVQIQFVEGQPAQTTVSTQVGTSFPGPAAAGR